jgi:hypothetical protein
MDNKLFEHIFSYFEHEGIVKNELIEPLEEEDSLNQLFEKIYYECRLKALFEQVLREANEAENNINAIKSIIPDISYNVDGNKIIINSEQYKNMQLNINQGIELVKEFSDIPILNKNTNTAIKITNQGIDHIKNPGFFKSSDKLLIIMQLSILIQNARFIKPTNMKK